MSVLSSFATHSGMNSDTHSGATPKLSEIIPDSVSEMIPDSVSEFIPEWVSELVRNTHSTCTPFRSTGSTPRVGPTH